MVDKFKAFASSKLGKAFLLGVVFTAGQVAQAAGVPGAADLLRLLGSIIAGL